MSSSCWRIFFICCLFAVHHVCVVRGFGGFRSDSLCPVLCMSDETQDMCQKCRMRKPLRFGKRSSIAILPAVTPAQRIRLGDQNEDESPRDLNLIESLDQATRFISDSPIEDGSSSASKSSRKSVVRKGSALSRMIKEFQNSRFRNMGLQENDDYF